MRECRAVNQILRLGAALLVTVSMLIGAVPGASAADTSEPTIVNGSAANIADYPYAVFLLTTKSDGLTYGCAGSFVTTSWIATAAHCVWDEAIGVPVGAGDVVARAGATNWQSAASLSVAELHVHPDFDYAAIRNDVAVLRLTTAQPSVTPIALNTNANLPQMSDAVTSVGWGSTCPRNSSGQYVPYTPTSTCSLNIVNSLRTGALRAQAGPGAPCRDLTASDYVPAENVCAIGVGPAPGYWLATNDGGLFSFGTATYLGGANSPTLQNSITGIAPHPSGYGYWLATNDGGVFAFGFAQYLGGANSPTLRNTITGIAATPTGDGYWMTTNDGGVFAFGGALYLGGANSPTLRNTITGIAPTPSGNGYWMSTNDGGVFAFGDAQYYGGANSPTLRNTITGIAATPTGKGYWLSTNDGGVFAFGDAQYLGGANSPTLRNTITGITPTGSGKGYWLTTNDGGLFTFGDAAYLGGANSPTLRNTIVGIGRTDSVSAACAGDSGGPLIQTVGGTPRLIGIYSAYKTCGRPEFPGMWTRVSYYASWINSYIAP